jgi:hypothetical protein
MKLYQNLNGNMKISQLRDREILTNKQNYKRIWYSTLPSRKEKESYTHTSLFSIAWLGEMHVPLDPHPFQLFRQHLFLSELHKCKF